ncbi:hypothetical protein ACFQMA_22175 [Halosimplex aquaticum]|uniref:Uncharacterized protein n=1 Tax=Halosimplex aquaticum TaxID=3026162 RepID=A0ABD5Y597_9EURY|nr:hypothetical protein [Halosimplex aquaticum]
MVNAFWLDRDLRQAAAWLVDRHVTSSVFECSMVLTTAVQLRGHEDDLSFTHADNPLTQWAADSFENWQYLRAYTDAAHEEWRYRWDHTPEESHGSWEQVAGLDLEAVRELDWPSTDLSDPPQLTGEWAADDYVDAYRYYYANDKRHLFSWARDRTEPPWIDEYTVEDPGDADDAGGANDAGDANEADDRSE